MAWYCPARPTLLLTADRANTSAATPPVFAPIRPHSSHAPPPPPAAMRSLLELELKFAALRDKLYLERMEEAAAEEEMLLNGGSLMWSWSSSDSAQALIPPFGIYTKPSRSAA